VWWLKLERVAEAALVFVAKNIYPMVGQMAVTAVMVVVFFSEAKKGSIL
jgi:hypothetical protein